MTHTLNKIGTLLCLLFCLNACTLASAEEISWDNLAYETQKAPQDCTTELSAGGAIKVKCN